MIFELLELNEHLFVDKARLDGPHSFRLVAHHETVRAIAASWRANRAGNPASVASHPCEHAERA